MGRPSNGYDVGAKDSWGIHDGIMKGEKPMIMPTLGAKLEALPSTKKTKKKSTNKNNDDSKKMKKQKSKVMMMAGVNDLDSDSDQSDSNNSDDDRSVVSMINKGSKKIRGVLSSAKVEMKNMLRGNSKSSKTTTNASSMYTSRNDEDDVSEASSQDDMSIDGSIKSFEGDDEINDSNSDIDSEDEAVITIPRPRSSAQPPQRPGVHQRHGNKYDNDGYEHNDNSRRGTSRSGTHNRAHNNLDGSLHRGAPSNSSSRHHRSILSSSNHDGRKNHPSRQPSRSGGSSDLQRSERTRSKHMVMDSLLGDGAAAAMPLGRQSEHSKRGHRRTSSDMMYPPANYQDGINDNSVRQQRTSNRGPPPRSRSMSMKSNTSCSPRQNDLVLQQRMEKRVPPRNMSGGVVKQPMVRRIPPKMNSMNKSSGPCERSCRPGPQVQCKSERTRSVNMTVDNLLDDSSSRDQEIGVQQVRMAKRIPPRSSSMNISSDHQPRRSSIDIAQPRRGNGIPPRTNSMNMGSNHGPRRSSLDFAPNGRSRGIPPRNNSMNISSDHVPRRSSVDHAPNGRNRGTPPRTNSINMTSNHGSRRSSLDNAPRHRGIPPRTNSINKSSDHKSCRSSLDNVPRSTGIPPRTNSFSKSSDHGSRRSSLDNAPTRSSGMPAMKKMSDHGPRRSSLDNAPVSARNRGGHRRTSSLTMSSDQRGGKIPPKNTSMKMSPATVKGIVFSSILDDTNIPSSSKPSMIFNLNFEQTPVTNNTCKSERTRSMDMTIDRLLADDVDNVHGIAAPFPKKKNNGNTKDNILNLGLDVMSKARSQRQQVEMQKSEMNSPPKDQCPPRRAQSDVSDSRQRRIS